jgi:dTDP-4-dehydrorhamnose reductase
MLARALRASAPASFDVVARTHEELDVADASHVAREVNAVRPALILNAAAYTAVDRAESEGDAAARVNSLAPGLLGRAAARVGAKVVHFSTDHVFDGTSCVPYSEDAETNPINAYGRSKRAGEIALRESGARHLIIRTQWLFGPGGRSFPSTMWMRASKGIPTRVVNDQMGSPTLSDDLARATWSLLPQQGILNVASEGATTWHGVAERIFATAGASHCLAPCSSSEYPTAAQRPQYAVLSTERLRSLGITMPAWTDALDRYLARLAAADD